MGRACAAVLEAKVSGIEVPSATKVMAVTAGGHPITQPKNPARSPTKMVMKAMYARATKKAGQLLPGTRVQKLTHAMATRERRFGACANLRLSQRHCQAVKKPKPNLNPLRSKINKTPATS